MRTRFIAGNWKMNMTVSEAVRMVESFKEKVADVKDIEIAICPPAIDIVPLNEILKDSNIELGAQNMHWEEKGAYTGELSASMITETGVKYIIIGHSERRQYFAETDQTVNRKVKAAFENGLKPIICVGETLEERDKGLTEEKVRIQVKSALAGLNDEDVAEIVIAYEPIWAIGTGESASPSVANEVIQIIRETVEKQYPGIAEKIRIQYGGSVKPHNIEDYISESDIDGALVGGASLDAESFASIITKSRP